MYYNSTFGELYKQEFTNVESENKLFRHPYDTGISAGFRFAAELIAWVSGPWAMASISKWLVLPTLIALVALPSIFSTINDKRNVVVATPGAIRVLIEFFLYLVACIAPWIVWSQSTSITAVIIVVVTIFLGVKRIIWLLKGAPSE